MKFTLLAGEASCPRCLWTAWGCFFSTPFREEAPIHPELARQYALNVDPVAFFDESYELESGAREHFYVIAVAVVDAEMLAGSRKALHDFYGGSALHAAPMFAKNELETLRQATQLVSTQNEGMDIVICAQIPDDTSRDAVRARCLATAAAKVYADWGTKLLVLDKLGTPTEDKLDRYTINDMRKASDGRLHRDTVAIHCQPSQEILLSLPDVLGWSYRQKHLGKDESWFEPLIDCTEVTILD